MPFSIQEMFTGVRSKLHLGEQPVIVAPNRHRARLIQAAIQPTISSITRVTLDTIQVEGGGLVVFRTSESENRGYRGPYYVMVEDDRNGGRWECRQRWLTPDPPPPPPTRFERVDTFVV